MRRIFAGEWVCDFPNCSRSSFRISLPPHAGVLRIQFRGKERPDSLGIDHIVFHQVQVPFRRGDSNGDSTVDISDAINTLRVLFDGEGELNCEDAGDTNDDGAVDISDPIATLSVLFNWSGTVPLPGMKDCGVDPTDDVMGCREYEGCP